MLRPRRSFASLAMIALLPGSAALAGCGARSSLDSGVRDETETTTTMTDTDTDTVTTSVPPVDTECVDPPLPPDGASCQTLDFEMPVLASCTIGTAPGAVLDGEGLLVDVNVGRRVLALDRWGKGHVMASCDVTLAASLWEEMDVERYLGQTDPPRVASVGFYFPCDPATGTSEVYPSLPETVTYLGDDLPEFYKGDPALLAGDWDAIILCPMNNGTSFGGWQSELQSFVSEHGKGLMALMDYHAMGQDTYFDGMNAVLQGSGVFFEKVHLDDDTLTVCSCVPDLPAP